MANSEPFQEHQRWFDVVHLHFTKVEKVKILRKEEKGQDIAFPHEGRQEVDPRVESTCAHSTVKMPRSLFFGR